MAQRALQHRRPGHHGAVPGPFQFLRVQEFIAAERKNQDRALADEEVWLMKSDGMEPRRLVRGSSPSWGKDSTCVYYQSHVDKALCSISVAGMDAEPKRLVPCSSALPSVSPDGQRVAYMEGGALKVKDLTSQAVIAGTVRYNGQIRLVPNGQ